MSSRTYLAIDLKSFYASVECRQRGLDPMTTNLVVADIERTEKTICLAVSPALKSFGVPGRPRLFEVVSRVRALNQERARRSPAGRLTGKSVFTTELAADASLAVDYLVARPQMAKYMQVSGDILGTYFRWVSPDDVHVYSIDEVFIDATAYLAHYGMSGRELAETMIHEVYRQTGITATAGIGENLYLAKVAMDILAKHAEPDAHGVRLAELTQRTYREQLWSHRPLRDFWRVGPATQRKLEALGIYTMGDVARASLGESYDRRSEETLYKTFGVGAELLIDHAWGWEPTTIADIKAYQPATKSLSSGQVMSRPYDFAQARLVVREMADALSLDLVAKRLTCAAVVLTVGYDVENLEADKRTYFGEVTTDAYGRSVPKEAHGTENLREPTSSTRELVAAVTRLFERIVNPRLSVRRMTVAFTRVAAEGTPGQTAWQTLDSEQLDLFTDYEALARREAGERAALELERRGQEAMLEIKRKFGKNAIFRGANLEAGATALERNRTSGGHRL